MKLIEIKENTREYASSFKYYVRMDKKVMMSQLTLKEAEDYKKRLEEYWNK